MSIEIANESGVEVDEASLASLARHVLDGMRVHPLAELSVLLVDEPAMTELHMRYMGEPGPTDVLAFPMDEIRPPQPGGTHADHNSTEPPEIPGLLGDVVICPQVAAVQARQAGHEVAGRDQPAVHARHPAPARLRPCRARGARDHVRAPGQAAGQLAWRGQPGNGAASQAGAASQDGAASPDGAGLDEGGGGQDEAGEEPREGPPR